MPEIGVNMRPMPLTWTTGPDADTATLELGGLKGELLILISIRVGDIQWWVGPGGPAGGPGEAAPIARYVDIQCVSGACTSRHDGRRAALDAIAQTLQTALMQVRDWRGDL